MRIHSSFAHKMLPSIMSSNEKIFKTHHRFFSTVKWQACEARPVARPLAGADFPSTDQDTPTKSNHSCQIRNHDGWYLVSTNEVLKITWMNPAGMFENWIWPQSTIHSLNWNGLWITEVTCWQFTATAFHRRTPVRISPWILMSRWSRQCVASVKCPPGFVPWWDGQCSQWF